MAISVTINYQLEVTYRLSNVDW